MAALTSIHLTPKGSFMTPSLRAIVLPFFSVVVAALVPVVLAAFLTIQRRGFEQQPAAVTPLRLPRRCSAIANSRSLRRIPQT